MLLLELKTYLSVHKSFWACRLRSCEERGYPLKASYELWV